MEQEFYGGRLMENFGLDVIMPDTGDRGLVHGVIYDELCLGKIEPDSKADFIGNIDLLSEGIQQVGRDR